MKKKILILLVSVALLVGILSGCVEEETPANKKPVASFDCISAAYMGDTVTFTDTSTDEDGEVASWSWLLDDVEVSTTNAYEGTFDTVATYTIKLTVTDDSGDESDVISCEITISYNPPEIALGDLPETITNTTEITFEATATEGDGTIGDEDYAWYIDDGTGEVMQEDMNMSTFVHTFAEDGTYTVKVMVTDSNGSTAEATVEVVVPTEPAEE